MFSNAYRSKRGNSIDRLYHNIDVPWFPQTAIHGLSFRDQVSLAILQLQERGSLQVMMRKWWYEKGECASVQEKVSIIWRLVQQQIVSSNFMILL